MTTTFTPQFDQRSPGLVNGYVRDEPAMVLAAGLPRMAAELVPVVAGIVTAAPQSPPQLPLQSNLVDLDSLATQLHRDGYCLWLRHDGEEFAVELECGVDVLPGNVPRPRGRGVTAADAIAAAVEDKVRVLKEQEKK